MKINKNTIIIGTPKSGKNIIILKEIAKTKAKQLTRNPIKKWLLSKKIFKTLLKQNY